MNILHYYIIWKTRNGQQLWDGPYLSKKVAQGTLDSMIAPRETGFGKVLPVTEEVERS
jgi:hypothetical protein